MSEALSIGNVDISFGGARWPDVTPSSISKSAGDYGDLSSVLTEAASHGLSFSYSPGYASYSDQGGSVSVSSGASHLNQVVMVDGQSFGSGGAQSSSSVSAISDIYKALI